MTGFLRNKLVSVRVLDDDTLLVHGVLDDDIYGLEMDVFLSVNTLQIKDIKGKWNRWTTKECPRAIPFLREGIGLSMKEEGFSQEIHKTVGRSSCRHFANLLLECCHTAKEATRVLQERDKSTNNDPKKDAEDRIDGNGDHLHEKADKQDTPGMSADENRFMGKEDQDTRHGTIIDLHTHSFPASQCSSVNVDDLIDQAKLIGLDGLCLTDHNHVWDHREIEDLRQKHGFLVLGGNEITTDQGDVLVFGLDKDIQGIIGLEALRKETDKQEGFIIAAHPFRGFLMFGVNRLGLTPEEAKDRTIFKYVDALEVMNGRVTIEENHFASDVAKGLGFRETGGSDAHEVDEVGTYATLFQAEIWDERGLIEALRESDFQPIPFRKEKKHRYHERG